MTLPYAGDQLASFEGVFPWAHQAYACASTRRGAAKQVLTTGECKHAPLSSAASLLYLCIEFILFLLSYIFLPYFVLCLTTTTTTGGRHLSPLLSLSWCVFHFATHLSYFKTLH